MPLRNRILLMILFISITAIAGIHTLITVNSRASLNKITNENAQNLMKIAMLTIENQYNSLKYHREYATELRKKERQNIMFVAISNIQKFYDDYKQGKISEKRAKERALEIINELRYDNGTGYIWINNTELPVPRMVIHPFYPEYNNKLALAPMFFTSSDSSNIPRMAVELSLEQGGGFIEYFWSKPTSKNDSLIIPKLSYVQIFKPWNWVLGTGVYLEDIEKDTEARRDAILKELRRTMGKIEINETGYFFIFDSQKDVIMHPVLDSQNPDSAIYFGSMAIFDSIMASVESGKGTYTYDWIRLNHQKEQFKHRKKVYIDYFEPLDWYVCASFYVKDIEQPATRLSNKILSYNLIFLVFTLIIAFFVSKELSLPIQRLMNFVAGLPKGEEERYADKIPVTGSKETKSLGIAIKQMLHSIEKHKTTLVNTKEEIESNERKYRTLFNSSGDAALMFENLKITECNERALKILNGTREQIIGKTLWDISPKYQLDCNSSEKNLERILEHADLNGPTEFEWLHLTLDGKVLNIDVTINLLDKATSRWLVTWRDVTAKKMAERALKASEAKFRFLVENTTVVLWIYHQDPGKRYISINAEKVLGVSAAEFHSDWQGQWQKLIHEEDTAYVSEATNELLEKGKPFELIFRVYANNGEIKWIQNRGERGSTDLGEDMFYGVIIDVTDKKLAEQKNLQTMIRAEEIERGRMAKDLHDGVSPLLSAIKLYIHSMRDTIDEMRREELIIKSSLVIDEAIQQVSEISANISPHILQNFGLIRAIESFAGHVSVPTGIKITIEAKISERFTQEVETTLYRTSVELINNTIKHAKADNIELIYKKLKHNIVFSYSDNGVGFDIKKTAQNSHGMGLFNLKNRIEALSGSFRLKSTMSKGTNVYITIPID